MKAIQAGVLSSLLFVGSCRFGYELPSDGPFEGAAEPGTGGGSASSGGDGETSTGGGSGGGGTSAGGTLSGDAGASAAGTPGGGGTPNGGGGTPNGGGGTPNGGGGTEGGSGSGGTASGGAPDNDAGTAIGGAPASDAGTPPDAGMGPPPLLPRHRYRFEGTGTTVLDDYGGQHGVVFNTVLDGDGNLTLTHDAASPQYVDLPDGIISSLTDVTVEAWFTRTDATASYTRLFDFGNQIGSRHGTSFGFAPTIANSRTAFDVDPATDGHNWRQVFTTFPWATDVLHHLTVVFDSAPSPSRLLVYSGGTLGGSTDVPDDESLSDLNDTDNWLGRPLWAPDEGFTGVFHDFRIYDVALTQPEIQQRFEDGPDAL